MSALAHLALGVGGAALLMGTWGLVQQRWLRDFAPRHQDALVARRGGPHNTDSCSGSGCGACSDRSGCGSNGGA